MMKGSALLWLLPSLAAAQLGTTTEAPPPWQTGEITPDGSCGGADGFVCTPTWGSCCSKDGQCGRSLAFCGTGCQPAFGNCNEVTPPKPDPQPGDMSPDGSCGGTNMFNCTGSSFGDCCSANGYCGDTAAHCGSGCQGLFGTCSAPTNVSSDGSCGTKNGKICLGSTFGDCCSPNGFCGDSDGHCGPGCQSGFGTCLAGEDVSTDGACGKNGKTCKGSTFGDCCSAGGFCGGTKEFCEAGCQSAFGDCSAEGGNISTDGSCGSKSGKTCKGSTYGDCCSAAGFCGESKDFCDAGCQPGFGTCSATGGDDVSTNGSCGKNGKTCKGSTFGDCCSANGFCGDSDGHCGTGCQPGFGTCSSTGGDGNVSTDGSCGKNGKTCQGSEFGSCCSANGFCGGTSDFCGVGCQAAFGTCNAGSGDISTDGACGKNGKTCKGSAFGDCCSENGYCGASTDHCGAGCQTAFGACVGSGSDVSTDSKCGKNGKTCKGSAFGNCCSANGFCGGSTDHCGTGCQAAFGLCGGGSGTGGVSTDAECGSRNGKTCVGSGFGNCCSSTGYCGSSTDHCGQGCQKSASNACLTTNIPSKDSTCGPKNGGMTCAGGPFDGQCCSAGGYCGASGDHCGSGCQRGYGRCN